MNCLKCGEKLPEGAKFCKGCGTIAGSKFQKVKSPLFRTEKIIRQGPCKRVMDGGRVQNGKAMLTNHRFVFFKTGLSRTFQMIFMRNMVTGDIYIPLTEIRQIMVWGQTPYQEMDFTITTKAGETYSFIFNSPMEWKKAIERAVIAVK